MVVGWGVLGCSVGAGKMRREKGKRKTRWKGEKREKGEKGKKRKRNPSSGFEPPAFRL